MKSWKTSLLGVTCIALAVWSAHDTFVPYQTLRFNLLHVWPGQIALLMTGIGLIFARDHSFKDRP